MARSKRSGRGGNRGPGPNFEQVQKSEDFALLRGRFRRFAFPLTALFLIWYLLYVLLSTYAVGFMSIRVIGHVNVGLLMGLGQFLTTFLITGLYVRHANRKLDPLSAKLRTQIEGPGSAPAATSGGAR